MYNWLHSDWLLSLTNMHLRFLHVLITFNFTTEQYSIVRIPHFIHSPTEGHHGFFWILAIMNKAATTICVQVLCRLTFSALLGTYQEVWVLNCVARVFFILWKTAKLSSKVSMPIFIPTSNVWELLFHILISIWCCHVWDFDHFNKLSRSI